MTIANAAPHSPLLKSTNLVKARSESSPAKMTSPAKQESPVMSSSEIKVPRLNLSSPVVNEETIKTSSEPLFKSPKSNLMASPRVTFAPPSAFTCSTSAPSTPRTKSCYATDVVSPRRHRIDNSPRKTSDSRKKGIDDGLQITASPRKLNSDVIQLGSEIAKLIFSEMRTRTPVLTKATIHQLGRFETMIPLGLLSPHLRSQVVDSTNGKVSHAKLIKAVFLPLLADSQVGKTLQTMRRSVMEQYDGGTLTLVDREMREAEEPGFKKRLLLNIEGEGRACAAIALGMTLPSLSASKLPAELILFWQAMDAELCRWAQANPDLSDTELRKARANLGFDLLCTRLILPMALGKKEEAQLAIPSMFFESVKIALLSNWPVFVDSFIAKVDGERPKLPLEHSSASARSTSVSTTQSVLVNSTEPAEDAPEAKKPVGSGIPVTSTQDLPADSAELKKERPAAEKNAF